MQSVRLTLEEMQYLLQELAGVPQDRNVAIEINILDELRHCINSEIEEAKYSSKR
jgi:hypothetical protein